MQLPVPLLRDALQPDGHPLRMPLPVPLQVIEQFPPAHVAAQFPTFSQLISQPPGDPIDPCPVEHPSLVAGPVFKFES